MNIVELMMVEHSVLRVHLRAVRERNLDTIYEVEDFVRNCHARIEDEVVFPKLKEIFEANKDEKLVKTLSRLEADHKLIEMIGEQIKVKTAEGDMDTMRKRTMLYADTLESHNASEENLVFQFWLPAESEEHELISRAKKIIEEYGRDRYFKITGVSEKLFDLAS